MPVSKNTKHPRFQVDNIHFTLSLIKAHIPIKFKCRFLVEIKTLSTTSSLKTLGKSKDQYRQTASLITFDPSQTFKFSHFLVYDNQLARYKKTQIQIVVSLISDSRGDEVKLVGRVRVDLNEFMSDNQGQLMRKEQELENCSVKKPDVAKITYELSLVKQEKMNIAENPDKQAIYAEIDRGVFADALEYNQFGKEVFGKDFSVICISKINRSLNDSSGNNIKMNDSISKLNASKEEGEENKSEVVDKGSVKEILNGSLVESKPKGQQIKLGGNKSIQSSSKISSSLVQGQSITTSKYSYKPPKQPIQNSSIQLSPLNQQPQLQQQRKPQPEPQKPAKTSPLKRAQQSPRHKSKLTQPVSQQMTQIEPQTQVKQNQLTQSMFDEQQMVIESLQQQLQQANEMIEQYRLEMELMKEETQRLENEKSMHASELETSRARNFSGALLSQAVLSQTLNNNDHSLQNETLKQEVQHYKQQLQQYKKIFAEKQEIIEEKDHVINNLSAEIQMAAHQMDLRVSQKEVIYNQLNEQYMLLKEEEIYLKGQVQKLTLILDQKTQDNHAYQAMVTELRAEIEALNHLVHESPVAQLSAQIQMKNLKIKELQQLIQKQKTTNVEYELKQTDFQNTINKLIKSLQQNKIKLSKSQQSSKKHQQQKQKAEQEMTKAVQKAKNIQKQKYQLTQQIANMNLATKNIDKLVEEKVLSYKAQLDQLALTYEQAQNKIAELKFAVQSYQSTLSLQQSKSQSTISQLTLKLQNFNKKQHLLRQSLDLLQNQSTKIRNFVEEKQNQLQDCEQLIRQKNQQLAEKNDKLSYLERKLRMNENAMNDLKLQLKMANTMNLQQRQDRQIQDGEQQYQTRLFILNQANMQLVQRQKQLTETIEERQQSIHDLKKLTITIEPLKREITSLQTKLNQSQQKCLQLKEQLKKLNRDTAENRSKTEQQSSQLQHAYKQCQKLQEQLNLVQDQKIMIMNQCQEREDQLVNVQGTLKTMTDSKKLLQKQLLNKDSQINNLKKQLSQSQKINEQLTKRLTNLQNSTLSEHHRKQELLIESRTLIKQQLQPLSAIRSPVKDIYTSPKNTRTKQQQQIYRLTQQLQAYKQRQQSYMCNVLDLQEQLQIAKKQKLSSSLNDHRQSIRKSQSLQPLVAYDKKDLKLACDQLQKLIEHRIKNRETENLIQMIVSNSQLLGGSESRGTNQQGTLFARQKNTLQEKSRILSRQVQKIKALIFKKPDIPYKNKTEIIQMLKPCETITGEIVKIGESFGRDQEDQLMSQH